MKVIAVVLSGCGVVDGSEITEAVGAIVALSQAGYTGRCYAPDRPQLEVFDHAAGRVMQDSRNIMVEAARIARSKIEPLSSLQLADVEGVLLPGGFGVAKNLSNFASRGQDARLAPDVAEALLPFMRAHKPIVGLCAAPLILALLARDAGIRGMRLTLGQKPGAVEMEQAFESWGQKTVECAVDEACIDETHRVASVPAYMVADATPAEVFGACQAAVSALGWLLSLDSAAE